MMLSLTKRSLGQNRNIYGGGGGGKSCYILLIFMDLPYRLIALGTRQAVEY